jgi:hypothetical protein
MIPMSIWTPGGEHEVPRETQPEPGAAAPGEAPDLSGIELPDGRSIEDLTPEERAQLEQIAAEMAETRRQLVEAPASTVIANHAMGLYELAAIHLSQEPPNLVEAKLAIDATAALVEGLEGRLEEAEPTLRNALQQLQLAYVQLSEDPPPAETAP